MPSPLRFVRMEASATAYKDKVFEFKVCEGIIKDNSDAPDMEEAEELLKEIV